eukprot:CAMPEP_0198197502 /NCGR_PEP_ID=MMETSP1445-20131203/1103_1 /TAXON_ID=36898 /ORGANISM="Pyramimonas sp., Strain CCMP2087" /LENGTH=187 /DNA_ID=CAMNT_0043866807 /DNA_START=63 /DNA_END=626 /DNA_ORIENTATION=-
MGVRVNLIITAVLCLMSQTTVQAAPQINTDVRINVPKLRGPTRPRQNNAQTAPLSRVASALGNARQQGGIPHVRSRNKTVQKIPAANPQAEPEWGQSHKAHTVVASKDWGAMDFLKAAAHHEDGLLKDSFKEHLDRPAAAKASPFHPHTFHHRHGYAKLGTATERRQALLEMSKNAGASKDVQQEAD